MSGDALRLRWEGRRGPVIAVLALQWPCFTDISGSSTHGLTAGVWDMITISKLRLLTNAGYFVSLVCL